MILMTKILGMTNEEHSTISIFYQCAYRLCKCCYCGNNSGYLSIKNSKKNIEIQENQLEESRNQFLMQMEKSQKEYVEKIEQLRKEQRKANLEKANDKLQAETNRFYEELIKEMVFYDSLLNELHYLNNIANPKDKEFRIKSAYPHIDNNIKI